MEEWNNFDHVSASINDTVSIKMNKFIEQLQILCSRRNLPQPNYVLKNETGPPHLKKFTFQCNVGEMVELATASSKTLSKHLAAEKMLRNLESLENSVPLVKSITEPIQKLQIKCSSNKFMQPTFNLIGEEGPSHNKIFTFECKIGSITETASGLSKAQAKHFVAAKILETLDSKVLGDVSQQADDVKEKLGLKSPLSEVGSSGASCDDKAFIKMNKFIEQLQILCCKNHLALPDYILKEENGPPHLRSFTYECSVGEIIESATASSKTLSKHLAAEKMLKNVELLITQIRDVTDKNITTPNSRKMTEYIELLQCLCSCKKLHQPLFSLIKEEGSPDNKLFTYECKVGDIVEMATGCNKRQTKHLAALKVLDKLYRDKYININLTDNSGGQKKNYISFAQLLIKYCAGMGLSMPLYFFVNEQGEPHLRKYTYQCQVDNIIETAVASNKRHAKQLVSEKVLERLKSECQVVESQSSQESHNARVLDLFVDAQLRKSRKFPTPKVIDLDKSFCDNPLALKIIQEYDEYSDCTTNNVVKTVCSLVDNTKICVVFEPCRSRNKNKIFLCSFMPDPYFVTFGFGANAKEKSAHKMMCLLKVFLKDHGPEFPE